MIKSLHTSPLSTEIHIYVMELSVLTPEDSEYLDTEERERAARFKFELHRNRFIAAHGGLRKILMKYLPENPVVLKTAQGKPYLKDYPHIQFNLSHSGDKALCAVTQDISLGIDIECHARADNTCNIMDIAERFFLVEEVEQLKLSQNPRALFFRLWTRKEAYIKQQGQSIAKGLHQKIPEDFMVQYFYPASGYTAALVFPKTFKALKFF